MIALRLALSVVIALGLVTAEASCQATPVVSNEQLLQRMEELRAEISALKRTVARLEKELAGAKAEPAEAPVSATASPLPPAKAPAAQVQCSGATTTGARCKRTAGKGSRFCWQHAGR